MPFKASMAAKHTIEFFEIASFMIEREIDARNARQVLSETRRFADVGIRCLLEETRWGWYANEAKPQSEEIRQRIRKKPVTTPRSLSLHPSESGASLPSHSGRRPRARPRGPSATSRNTYPIAFPTFPPFHVTSSPNSWLL